MRGSTAANEQIPYLIFLLLFPISEIEANLMKMQFRKVFSFLLFAAAFLIAYPSLAQTSYGSLAGSITDQSGAAIPNATITARNTDTGETHVTASKANGGYLIEAIGTGSYDITVES